MGGRKRVVLVHEDESVIALLRALLEAEGYAVEVHHDIDDAEARLVRAPVDAVVTDWDRPIGRDLYRRVADAHRDVRHRFVFLVDGAIPEKLADAAARRRVVLLADVVGIVEAVGIRARRVARPRLLLVDDDVEQLACMSGLLTEEGFDVTTATGGVAAIAILEAASFDHVLSDWKMEEGSGADLHQWIATSRPDLLARLVFLTGGDPVEPARAVEPVPVLPKGQDSPTLLAALRQSTTSAASPPFADGTPPRGIATIREAAEPTAEHLPPIPAPPPSRRLVLLPPHELDEPTQVDSANVGS